MMKNPEEISKNKNDEKRSLPLKAIIFGLVLVSVLGIFLARDRLFKTNLSRENNPSLLSYLLKKPAPSPFPFQELTIPYLRNRAYQSSLADLEKLSENSAYASYLTSYDSDGLRINGFLTIPQGEPPDGGWPAIVFVHGYIPPSEYQTTTHYTAYVDYLASNGFVVSKIDLRGHGQSEGEASGAYYSSDYIIDTLNAYAALQSADFVNPAKIGLWGHSMAGNIVFRSLVVKKDIPAVVIWAGAVYTYEDFAQYHISDDSYRPPSQTSERRRARENLMATYGDFDPNNEFWQQVVPTNYLDGVTSAIQIDHAVDDLVVNIGYSRNLINLLEKTPITAELNEYPSGGHNLSGATFDLAMAKTVSFFKQYLNE